MQYRSKVMKWAMLEKWIVTTSEGANAGRDKNGPYTRRLSF